MIWQQSADFYSNLRRMLHAGFVISEALEHSSGECKGPYRKRALAWSQACAAGAELHEVMNDETAFTRSLIEAGEKSGRLPDMCRAISDFYQQAHNTRRYVIGKLIYPIFLMHAAFAVLILFAVLGFVEPWIAYTSPAVVWTTAIITLILFMKQPPFIQRLIIWKPLNIISTPLFTHVSCLVLEAAVSSGMKYPQALELSAKCIPNSIVQKQFREVAHKIEHNNNNDSGESDKSGESNKSSESLRISDAFQAASFSRTTIDLCRNGEHSGELEECLQRCAVLEGERFRSALDWGSKILYALVYGTALLIAVSIILSFYAGYVNAIRSIG